MFHTAFIIIIIGAGVTRYIGYEGLMHIREGATSNFIFSNQNYLNIRASDGTENYDLDKELNFGMITNNDFDLKVETKSKGEVLIGYPDTTRNLAEFQI